VEFLPTREQAEIVYAGIDSGQSALVVAGPGTGKTRTALEAARRKIAAIQDSPRQILFLSFSNAAIQRLISASGEHLSSIERRKLRFMTYHSCAAELLRTYGRFVGLPPTIRIADKLEEHLIRLELGWEGDEVATQARLGELARAEGVLAFDVLIPLAVKLLSSSPRLKDVITRRYPLIFADEFQDTSEWQWSFLKALGDDRQVMAFGDPNQIIYSSMHAATERRMEEFLAWKMVEVSEFSGKNFRCGVAEILTFATAMLHATPRVPAKGSGVTLIDAKFRSKLRAHLAIIWRNVREKVGANESVAFLAPSNSLVEEIAVSLRTPSPDSPISFPVYAQMARDEAAHDAVMLSLVAMRDMAVNPTELTRKKAAVAVLAMNSMWNSRKKITPANLKKVMRTFNSTKPGDGSSLGTLLQTLLRGGEINKQVGAFLECLKEDSDFITSVKRVQAHSRLTVQRVIVSDPQLSLFDELRAARQPKGLQGYDAWEGKTHVLTYHKAKGREFDFVVMIVDPRGESGKQPLDEKRRLYYVSATRAKKWLGVVHFGDQLGPVLGPVLKPV
jgi:hypothetical protein